MFNIRVTYCFTKAYGGGVEQNSIFGPEGVFKVSKGNCFCLILQINS